VSFFSDRVELGGTTLELERPVNAEALIDEARFGEDEFLPYWGELWPSGIALARHVADLDLAGLRVLELGCGLGLPSLAAARGGADVVATDWADDALDLLAGNALRNDLVLGTMHLEWSRPEPLLALEPFDLVLAADVLYEARNVTPLVELLDALRGPALIADPGRRFAGDFVARLRAAGWRVESCAQRALPRGAVHHLDPRVAEEGA